MEKRWISGSFVARVSGRKVKSVKLVTAVRCKPILGADFALHRLKYWKEEPKCFNLTCVVRLLIKISIVVVTVMQFCTYIVWTRNYQYRCE